MGCLSGESGVKRIAGQAILSDRRFGANGIEDLTTLKNVSSD
jgi:hypothetical protein